MYVFFVAVACGYRHSISPINIFSIFWFGSKQFTLGQRARYHLNRALNLHESTWVSCNARVYQYIVQSHDTRSSLNGRRQRQISSDLTGFYSFLFAVFHSRDLIFIRVVRIHSWDSDLVRFIFQIAMPIWRKCFRRIFAAQLILFGIRRWCDCKIYSWLVYCMFFFCAIVCIGSHFPSSDKTEQRYLKSNILKRALNTKNPMGSETCKKNLSKNYRFETLQYRKLQFRMFGKRFTKTAIATEMSPCRTAYVQRSSLQAKYILVYLNTVLALFRIN